MSSPEDESPPPPSFLQPSRRSRLGRGARQTQERRIPGAPEPVAEPSEFFPATETPSAEEAASPSTEPAGAGEPEPRAVAYRPPARGNETTWSGTQSDPVDAYVPPGPRSRPWRLPLLLFLLGTGLGGGVGFWFGGGGTPPAAASSRPGAGTTPRLSLEPEVVAPLSPLTSELSAGTLASVVADVDEAYTALRTGKFADADASLRAAQARRPLPPGPRLSGVPAGWPELEVERARVRFYAGDLKGADQALDALSRAPGTASARADTLLLRALIQGALRAPALADDLFAAAAAANPTRADVFFFWGNALRTEGKPAESIPKFRAALLRNQFETMDGLIRLKLWTSQFQVDAQAPEAAAAIDAALAPPNAPSGYTWMGAGARAIREGRFADAAGSFRKARALLEPVLFRVVLSDPMFAEQSWRPELAEFFR